MEQKKNAHSRHTLACWLCWIVAAMVAVALAAPAPPAEAAEPKPAAVKNAEKPSQAAAPRGRADNQKTSADQQSAGNAGQTAASELPAIRPPASAVAKAAFPPDPRLDRIFAGGVPENSQDLKAMQERVRQVTERVLKATVGIRLLGGMGSGVIVSEDGHVLTAGHVVGRPGQEVTIIFPNGRQVKGQTLGANFGIDSGMIKITDEGKWPYVEMAPSARVKQGQWCIVAGQPGGFEKGRTPPVRLGRVLEVSGTSIVTDGALVGGDSGGPLFDAAGRVIGIHSRIGNELHTNIHVPIATYRDTWDRLVNSEVWGGRRPGGPFIGVVADAGASTATIGEVLDGSPADEAGLRKGDIIVALDGAKIPTFESLVDEVSRHEPGDRVTVEVRRGGETIQLEVVIGRHGG